MAHHKTLVVWRVTWPLVIWFLASAVITWVLYSSGDIGAGEGSRESLLGNAWSLCLAIGTVSTSLLVARRYKRFIGRPVSRILKICLIFLLVLGVLGICAGAFGLALLIATL